MGASFGGLLSVFLQPLWPSISTRASGSGFRTDSDVKMTNRDDKMLAMRTTIRLDDDLYRDVKAQAAREGRTVGEVIEDALRTRDRRATTDTPLEPLPVYGGGGVLPGVDLSDNAALRDVMDAGESLDALR